MNKDRWLRRYQLALQFAAHFDSTHRFDVVHNAWLLYQERAGEDLFQVDLRNESSFLYTVIKRAFLWWYYHERRSERYQWIGTEDLAGVDDPFEVLVGKDLYEVFYQRLQQMTQKEGEHRHYRTQWRENLPMEVFRLRASGYTQAEIARELKVTKPLVGMYVKKIETMMNYTNPFPGSDTKIKQRPMSEKTWKKFIKRRGNQAKFALEDANEFVKLFTHKELGHGVLVKVAAPKGAEHYIKRGVDNGTL